MRLIIAAAAACLAFPALAQVENPFAREEFHVTIPRWGIDVRGDSASINRPGCNVPVYIKAEVLDASNVTVESVNLTSSGCKYADKSQVRDVVFGVRQQSADTVTLSGVTRRVGLLLTAIRQPGESPDVAALDIIADRATLPASARTDMVYETAPDVVLSAARVQVVHKAGATAPVVAVVPFEGGDPLRLRVTVYP